MLEMVSVFDRRLKYVGKYVDMSEMAKIIGKLLNYLTNGLNLWKMT